MALSGTLGAFGIPANARRLSLAVDTTLTVADLQTVVLMDTSGGPLTLTVPPANTVGSGGRFFIVAPDGATNALTVGLSGSTFNLGQAGPIVLSADNDSLLLISDGVNEYAVVFSSPASAAPPGASSAVLMWGNSNVAASTAQRVLTPWYNDSQAPTTASTTLQYPIPRAGTIQNMRVRHNSPAGNGEDIVYTLRVGGVNSALTVTLASTATAGSDLVSTVPVAAADLLDVIVDKALAVGSSPNEIVVTFEFV